MAYNPGMNYNPTGGMAPYSPYSYMNYANGAAPVYTPAPLPVVNNNTMQNQMPTNQPSVAIQGRMVTSREEALGVPVDFTGTPMYFPDMSHGVIYCKKFNMNTGAADFAEFRLFNPQPQSQEVQQALPAPSFVPMEDFQNLQDVVNGLQKEIEGLKKPTSSNNSKGVKKDESDAK